MRKTALMFCSVSTVAPRSRSTVAYLTGLAREFMIRQVRYGCLDRSTDYPQL